MYAYMYAFKAIALLLPAMTLATPIFSRRPTRERHFCSKVTFATPIFSRRPTRERYFCPFDDRCNTHFLETSHARALLLLKIGPGKTHFLEASHARAALSAPR